MKVALFGGTTEGRVLADQLRLRGIDVTVFVATDYGKEVLPKEAMDVRVGRLTETEMEEVLKDGCFELCVDATHPYAALVTKNIATACEACGLKLLRIGRKQLGDVDPGIHYVASAAEAAEFLAGQEGRILLTTGSKELPAFSAVTDYKERLVVRLLATEEALSICDEMGILGANRICMQGPFSETMNYATLRDYGCRWIVTKESGSAGGYEAKIRAAKRAGVGIVVIGRPKGEGIPEYSVAEAVSIITGGDHPDEAREAYVIGAGVGAFDMMTVGAFRILVKADLIVGAPRVLEMLDAIPAVFVGEGIRADRLPEYRAPYIMEYLNEHPEYKKVAIMFSGDVGFFSGAHDMLIALNGSRFKTEIIPGIASPIYMLDKMQIPWQKVRMVSNHGREADIGTLIDQNRYVFTLVGGGRTVASICSELLVKGRGEVKVTVAERLSYPEEKFTTATAEELTSSAFDPLSVALFENEQIKTEEEETWT